MNNVKTLVLMSVLGALVVLVGQVLFGGTGAVIGLVIAAAMNFAMYFFSDKLALKASGAVPIPDGELPEVREIVAKLAAAEDMPMPRLYYIDAPQPNAFATGRNPEHAAVAVTAGILQMMNYEELEGVLAHELAHVKNRDILISSVAATMAAALSIFARMGMFGMMGRDRRDNPIAGIIALLSIIVAPLAAMVIRFAIGRAREYQADRSGAQTTGRPMALASALAKLERGTSQVPMQVNPAVAPLYIADPLKAFGNRGGGGLGGLARMFSTHPPIPSRIERLREMQETR